MRRVPLQRRGFDDFLAPSNLSHVAMSHAVGRGEPVNRVADLDDVVATWAVLAGDGWEDPRSARQLRRDAKETRRLARSIIVACEDRVAVLDEGEDVDHPKG
ncbi:MAG: hypothetical protein ACYCUM_13630 [Solirubrobacteraceae bacterium]